MKYSSKRKAATLSVVVALAAVAVFFGWRQLSAPSTESASISATAVGGGIMDSSAHVTASFTVNGKDGIVTLHIGKNWHVNANPASLDNLIASTILIEHDGSQREAQATYPPGKSSGIIIDGTDVLVYENGVAVPVQSLGSEPSDRVLVRVQACNTQGVCLAPATITASNGQI
ncbi:MAG: hypothetical protein EPN76_04335 [Burkholderiaceae bacterium]|nr:MAG: hypothetical protein EPN76_04335 [Burkholderiaceae bacterium]TAM02742.1 MAG: hypothetical protein EPN67_10595 [Pusillimonas sp.]